MTELVPGVEFRFIETNGIRMKIAEIGEGPLVVLAHGWPDSWLSWRHQMLALADEGYHAVALQMRGYGETDAPEAVEAYDIAHLARDIAGAIDALGGGRGHLVGHDWGSMAAAGAAMFHPEKLASLTLMSVPLTPRSAVPPLSIFRELFGDSFFYILYHNEPDGIAEAEYDSDVRGVLSRFFLSPDAARHDPEISEPHRRAGGWIGRLGAPIEPPDWLSAAEFDEMVAMLEKSGFRGGINYYRNFDRNWELTEAVASVKVPMPAMFLAGDQDVVIMGRTADDLEESMNETMADLRRVTLIPGPGHWVQQENPGAVSESLVSFFQEVDA